MKLIIAGSRDIDTDIAYAEIVKWRLQDIEHHEIVSGGNGRYDYQTKKFMGVDIAGERYAEFYDLQCSKFLADWQKHGRAAGPIRNKQMAEYADALLLVWDGESRGSKNMKENMIKLNKPIFEVILRRINE